MTFLPEAALMVAIMGPPVAMTASAVWMHLRSRRRNRRGRCAFCDGDILGKAELYLTNGTYICPSCAVGARRNLVGLMIAMPLTVLGTALALGGPVFLTLPVGAGMWLGLRRSKAANRRADLGPGPDNVWLEDRTL